MPQGAGVDVRLYYVCRSDLFRGLAQGECLEIARLARERRVVRRESFYLQGDPAEEVLVLCAGRVKATVARDDGEESIVRLTGPGEAFGALDVLDSACHPSGAEALEASHALIWSRAALDAVADRNPVLLRNFSAVLAGQVRDLEERCHALVSQRVPERVSSTLVRLAREIGRPVEGGVLVSLSREEIAQLTGTTLFSVSRLLSDWQARGVVLARRAAVVVCNPFGLLAAGRTTSSKGEALRMLA
jgi:CRP-like cAMP-binding protein